MPDYAITCPYCFFEFKDDDVHFRMETVFSENELDPKGEGRRRDEIELDGRFSNDEIRMQLSEYDRREKFLKREDTVYEDFWDDFGGTTEKASVSRDGKTPSVMPYQRPVFDRKNPEHMKYFSAPPKVQDVINDGMVYAAYDVFGHQTTRRVCPKCHNPLPGSYGKHTVKFISIIGITGSGKTVYLSQLCKFMAKQLANFNITAIPTSIYAKEYLEANPVKMNKELPVGTPPEQLLQPLCFDLEYKLNGENTCYTIVFYDIAGENCVDAQSMQKFAKFVMKSHGILLLIDPGSFDGENNIGQSVDVLTTIHNAFLGKNSKELSNLPLAVCVSKGDQVAQELIHASLDDVQFLRDTNGDYIPEFDSNDYNPITDAIKRFVDDNDTELYNHLRIKYDNFNFFIFSALGTTTKTVKTVNGQMYEADPNDLAAIRVPAGPTNPKRIIEPILWLLYKYKFISARGQIHEPTDWICKSCGKRLRVNMKYCPECKTNNFGQWKCSKCDNENNTGEWCSKCKRNKFGKKKSLFSK